MPMCLFRPFGVSFFYILATFAFCKPYGVPVTAESPPDHVWPSCFFFSVVGPLREPIFPLSFSPGVEKLLLGWGRSESCCIFSLLNLFYTVAFLYVVHSRANPLACVCSLYVEVSLSGDCMPGIIKKNNNKEVAWAQRRKAHVVERGSVFGRVY